jgi:hypothetical protein
MVQNIRKFYFIIVKIIIFKNKFSFKRNIFYLIQKKIK